MKIQYTISLHKTRLCTDLACKPLTPLAATIADPCSEDPSGAHRPLQIEPTPTIEDIGGV